MYTSYYRDRSLVLHTEIHDLIFLFMDIQFLLHANCILEEKDKISKKFMTVIIEGNRF